MEKKERKVLHLRFGLALLKILNERKNTSKANKLEGIKDHKLVSSLRKLSAASGVDFGTVQKISKGYQGLEFFTFIDLIEALDLDLITFGECFNSISSEDVKAEIEKRKSKKKVKKKLK
jgi:hypothetical protein